MKHSSPPAPSNGSNHSICPSLLDSTKLTTCPAEAQNIYHQTSPPSSPNYSPDSSTSNTIRRSLTSYFMNCTLNPIATSDSKQMSPAEEYAQMPLERKLAARGRVNTLKASLSIPIENGGSVVNGVPVHSPSGCSSLRKEFDEHVTYDVCG